MARKKTPKHAKADVPARSAIRCTLDEVTDLSLRGWALDATDPQATPLLHVIVDGQEIGTVACDQDRAEGGRDFATSLPPGLADGRVHHLTMRDQRRQEVVITWAGQDYVHIDLVLDSKPIVRSFVDGLRHGAFEGWVLRGTQGAPDLHGDSMVRVTCDGVTVGHTRANSFRGDVARAVSGPSNCGFRYEPPPAVRNGYSRTFGFYLMPENIELDNSPCQTSLLEDESQQRLAALSTAVDSLHRELTRIRRQLHEIAPRARHTIHGYDRWFRSYEPALRRRVAASRPEAGWDDGPLVSIVCPVYRPLLSDFRAALESILGQTYRRIELILVDDNSQDKALAAVLSEVAKADPRVRVLRNRKNLRISGATNVALKAARGTFVAFVDHDDVLVDVAIECMVAAALKTGADVLYSDEDMVDQSGQYRTPAFKPGWNHRLALGVNYVCHLLFVRRAVAEAVGLLDGAYDGAQDHDYILRLSEHVGPGAIHHVPEVLYHWRITAGSTAETVDNKAYAVAAGAKAVGDHLARIGRPAKVEPIEGKTLYRQTWLVDAEPKVTLIIPYKDQIEITRKCVDAVLSVTDYTNYDVILVDNWSTSDEAMAFAKWARTNRRLRVMRIEEDFNYSRLNNLAVRESDAEFYMFMNNDLFVMNRDWLKAVVAEALVDPRVGAVGGKFFYPDGTVQHGGVVTGIGGVAAHTHTGLREGDYGFGQRLLFAQEMTAVTAAGVLVRASVFDAVGGFDEQHLKVAFNDVDLCLKIRAAGHTIIWTPAFVAEHHESLSRGDDERPMQENRFFDEVEVMKARWGETLVNDPYYSPHFLLDRMAFFDLKDPDDA